MRLKSSVADSGPWLGSRRSFSSVTIGSTDGHLVLNLLLRSCHSATPKFIPVVVHAGHPQIRLTGERTSCPPQVQRARVPVAPVGGLLRADSLLMASRGRATSMSLPDRWSCCFLGQICLKLAQTITCKLRDSCVPRNYHVISAQSRTETLPALDHDGISESLGSVFSDRDTNGCL